MANVNGNVLQAVGLTKKFRRKTVLDGLDLDVEPGAVTVLLGRNGAGKSTFMRLALGVLKPDKGALTVCGFDPLAQARAVRCAVGYVPDKPDVYDWMTARELFSFLEPQYPTWSWSVVTATAESLQVPLGTPFGAMSRGEGMKAMLVAALAPEPDLLLLDEPFAGLDPVAREEVLRGVIGELREGQRTVLCATHDLDVAARIADRVVLLCKGKIASHGAVDEVLGEDEEPARAPERLKRMLAEVTS